MSDNADSSTFCEGDGVIMYMGFSGSHRECLIFLVSRWVLDERWKYWLACLGTFLLALTSQLFLFIKQYRDRSQMGGYTKGLLPLRILINTLLTGMTLILGYMVMVLVMTYDLGFFAAACCGLSIEFMLEASVASHVNETPNSRLPPPEGQSLNAALLSNLRVSDMSGSTFTELTSVEEDICCVD